MELDNSLTPITALAFFRLERLYLLAGESHCLRIFDHQSNNLVFAKQIFASQAIHGIFSISLEVNHPILENILAYGGRSIRLLQASNESRSDTLDVNFTTPEISVDDWILDARLAQASNYTKSDEISSVAVLVVTAHNDLLLLDVSPPSSLTLEEGRFRTLARGPRSILYSAHISFRDPQKIIIASGTVTGEILLWSVLRDGSDDSQTVCQVYCTLRGHEGSVFGVRISHLNQPADGPSCLLASCSDDRSILIWDVSGMDGLDAEAKPVGNLLAKAMAHASRIWAVRFLPGPNGSNRLISFGEDSSACLWLIQPSLNTESQIGSKDLMKIERKTTYSHHSGKNLWAYTVFGEVDGSPLVATGGADGRVVTYRISSQSDSIDASLHRFTMTEMLKLDKLSKSRQFANEPSSKTLKQKIFDAMIGRWKLSRIIKSALPTHPSGKLEGTAKLEMRDTTNSAYDQECIYSEQGDFTTDTGLTMKANRQYVYRYERKSDEISIWFIKSEGEAVDYLFHKLDFEGDAFGRCSPDSKQGSCQIMASGQHFCQPDTYYPEYEFQLSDTILSSWQIQYSVKGPQKDYISKASYIPELSSQEMTGSEGIFESSTKAANGHITNTFKHDAIKSYVWMNENEVLATTESGNLMVGHVLQQDDKKKLKEASSNTNIKEKSKWMWEFVGSRSGLKSRSIMSSALSSGVAFLTGSDGVVYQYHNETRQLTVFNKGAEILGYLAAQRLQDAGENLREYPSSMCLVTQSIGLRPSETILLDVEESTRSISLASHISFETTGRVASTKPKFRTSSSLYLKDQGLLLEGSRYGELRIRRSFTSQLWQFSGIHGTDAITVILLLTTNLSEHKVYVLTAGRNGRYAYHELFLDPLRPSKAKFTTIHNASPPFGPNIEGALITSATSHLVLWGFMSTQFVVWNESLKSEIISIECGGTHRSWAYMQHSETGGGSFIWNKASTSNVYRQPQPSHQVLQYGGHGREIKAMAISPAQVADTDGRSITLIATGAEDTMTCLFTHNVEGFKCVNRLTEHTTGVQTLRWSSDSRWLFSAGGCEEFFVWQIRWLNGLPCVLCDAYCPQVTDQKDLRVMDFAVEESTAVSPSSDSQPDYIITTAYSDSSIRVYCFSAKLLSADNKTNPFTLLSSASYGTNCLTQLRSLNLNGRKVLCTASSDGHLALWYHSKHPDQSPTILQRHIIHQSSIKSLLIINLSETAKRTTIGAEHQLFTSEYLIITGGDDQALALTRLTYPPSSNNSAHPKLQLATLLIPNAHASAITGIAALGEAIERESYRFATVGNDQRLKTWGVSFDGNKVGVEAVRVKRIRNVYTGVADASSLEGYVDAEGAWRVLVAGIGMESWKLEKDSYS